MIKRLSPIETIGHINLDGNLSRNPLKAALGDALHAVMCGAGFNIQLLLSKLSFFCAQIRLPKREVLQAIRMAKYSYCSFGG